MGGICSTCGDVRNTCILAGQCKGRDRLREVRVEVRIILKWILETYGMRIWTGFNCL